MLSSVGWSLLGADVVAFLLAVFITNRRYLPRILKIVARNGFVLSLLLLSYECMLGASVTAPRPVSVVLPPPASASGDSIVGGPSLSASFINQVLARAGSPASGKGQYLYDEGVKYRIDPAFALAFFMHESTFGTKGEATVTLALGNERCIADRPCIDKDRGGYAQFYSWEDGFDHWYSMMSDGYVKGNINMVIGRAVCPCRTIAQIIPVYAPMVDHNNEQGYIDSVRYAVMLWRSGKM